MTIVCATATGCYEKEERIGAVNHEKAIDHQEKAGQAAQVECRKRADQMRSLFSALTGNGFPDEEPPTPGGCQSGIKTNYREY